MKPIRRPQLAADIAGIEELTEPQLSPGQWEALVKITRAQLEEDVWNSMNTAVGPEDERF